MPDVSRYPALPVLDEEAPDKIGIENLFSFGESVKELLEIMLGIRGKNKLDRMMSGQDLVNLGLASPLRVNTLDSSVIVNPDFRAGTWVPALQFGGAAVGMTIGTSHGGNWRRIGDFITAWGRIQLTDKGSSTGAATIRGIPFSFGTEVSGLNNQAGFNVHWMANMVGITAAFATLTTVGVSFPLFQFTATDTVALDDTNFGDTSELIFALNYFTDQP